MHSVENNMKIPLRDFLRQALRFYIPLAIQSTAQSLTYPLVASIVSHGPLGSTEYGAFAQGQILLFLFGAIGSGLITTGMVFARTKTGLATFSRLVVRMALAVNALQLLACAPPFDHLIFDVVLRLDAEHARIARNTMLAGVPMQLAFFLRNIYLVVLYNARESVLANNATMARIALTAALSPLFVRAGLSGHLWGMLVMTVPVWLELILTKRYARKFIARLADPPYAEQAPLAKQFIFTMPLSFGGMLLSVSAFMTGIFLARIEDPAAPAALIVSIHYIVMGIVNPLGFAGLKMQSLAIAFPPEEYGAARMRAFTLVTGLALASAIFVLQIPALARWYFGAIQNLAPEHVSLAKSTALVMAAHPFLQTVRGRLEGLAALRRRPNAILAGQAVFLATMLMSLLFFTRLQTIPSNMIGGLSILISILTTIITIRVALLWNDFEDKYGAAAAKPQAVPAPPEQK